MKLPCTLSERATNSTKALPPQGWHRGLFSITTGCIKDNNPVADFMLSPSQSLQFSFGSAAALYSVLTLTSSAELPTHMTSGKGFFLLMPSLIVSLPNRFTSFQATVYPQSLPWTVLWPFLTFRTPDGMTQNTFFYFAIFFSCSFWNNCFHINTTVLYTCVYTTLKVEQKWDLSVFLQLEHFVIKLNTLQG